jgi:hypothetical protein
MTPEQSQAFTDECVSGYRQARENNEPERAIDLRKRWAEYNGTDDLAEIAIVDPFDQDQESGVPVGNE